MHFSNGRFSNKETGFSGPYVVWSLLGAPGEKKKEKTKCIYSRAEKKFARGRFLFQRKKETLTMDFRRFCARNLPDRRCQVADFAREICEVADFAGGICPDR